MNDWWVRECPRKVFWLSYDVEQTLENFSAKGKGGRGLLAS